MGRFISADDRVVENGNVFSYCSNNPIINNDKDGHKKFSLLKLLKKVNKVIKNCIKEVRRAIIRQNIATITGNLSRLPIVEFLTTGARLKNLKSDSKKANYAKVDVWLTNMIKSPKNGPVIDIQLPEDPDGLMYNKINRDYASRRLIGFYAEGTSRSVENISDEIFAHQFGADLTRPLLSGFDDKILGRPNPYYQFKYTNLNEDEHKHLGYKIVTLLFD